jgi:hypothetical protein
MHDQEEIWRGRGSGRIDNRKNSLYRIYFVSTQKRDEIGHKREAGG